MNKQKGMVLCVCLCIATSVFSQGKIEDYHRAFQIYGEYNGKTRNVDVNPINIDGKDAFWYLLESESGTEYVYLDAHSQATRPLFNKENLAGSLSSQVGHKVDAVSLRLNGLMYDDVHSTLRFQYENKPYVYEINGNSLKVEAGNGAGNGWRGRAQRQRHWMEVDDERDEASILSPDKQWYAYVRENNVWISRASDRSQARQLSYDGTEGFYYSSRLQWSPDSKNLAVYRLRPALKHYVYYVESSPKEQLQPILHKQEYAKPGDELNFKVPCIFSIDGKQSIKPQMSLFDPQYAMSEIRWDDDSRAITFEYNARGHKVYRVQELSAVNGELRTLIEESSDQYVNYPFLWRYDLKGGRYILWASERDNYKNLYMFDRRKAAVDHQITKRKWYVRDVLRVDEESRTIWFTANGDNVDGEDPYFIHYYKVDFDGKNLVALTPELGTHHAVFSSNFQYMIDTYSTVETSPVTALRRTTDGHVLKTIATADIDGLRNAGWKAPESFCAKGRDGKTDMWGIIVRPSNFDSTKKYPIIEYIYAGPGSQYVSKSFHSFYWDMSNLAELGFIVVQVDGMGTSFRSRTFETVCYKNLKDAGLPDHIAWLKAAAKRYPSMDTTRVGIFGASAGGQESLAAVLFHPEFYKAAYSGCGCHDNRMDKVWWNELWMGYPVDTSYIENSNVANAARLTRPLMLVVGALDDNVDPASTMQVADALIRANKDFELVVLPNEHHTLGGRFGEHKRYDFFVKNLWGIEPPKWDEVGN